MRDLKAGECRLPIHRANSTFTQIIRQSYENEPVTIVLVALS
jgi:hypothetical protein